MKDSQYPILPNDAFMLAIQTEWQKGNFPVQFCAPTLPMEQMLKLITCIVPDEYGKGDTDVFELFLRFFWYGVIPTSDPSSLELKNAEYIVVQH